MQEKPRILVIDDEHAIRETIRENLADCGYDVLEAVNGAEGLKIVEGFNPPKIVITDIIMPLHDGLEAIMQIRRKHKNIRLIAMSGGGQGRNHDFLELARKMGADAILPKPFDMAELETTVRKLLG